MISFITYLKCTNLPDFLHATQVASFLVAEDCIPEVVESKSQTGAVDDTLHPWYAPETSDPQTLHALVVRQIKFDGDEGHSELDPMFTKM